MAPNEVWLKNTEAFLAHWESDAADAYRARHHQRERGIPVARQVQKPENLRGIGHARDDEAEAEEQADGEGGQCRRQVARRATEQHGERQGR